jgi:Flp pilus assembly protein TadD
MNLLRPLVPALLAVALGAVEGLPGTAPTAEMWKPVADALAKGSPEAEPQLQALSAKFPSWSDGPREIAYLQLRAGRHEAALASIRAARTIAPQDPELIPLEMRCLAAAGKLEEAYALVVRSAGKDPRGALRLEAGLLAVAHGDPSRATTFLAEAKLRCGPRIPPEVLILEARIAILNKDLSRAEVALSSAVGQQENHGDAWRELGRVRLARAEANPAEVLALSSGAEQAFAKAVACNPRDAVSRIGLGRARIQLADSLNQSGDVARATLALNQAIPPLEEAVALNPQASEGHALLGQVTLRLGFHQGAVVHLRRAQELKSPERTLAIDLATALGRTGETAAAEEILNSVTFASPAHQLLAGLEAYDGGNDPQAVRWLTDAAPNLPGQSLKAATWRYAGHAALRQADKDPGQTEAWRDKAAAAYHQALQLGDRQALTHLLALESPRSPTHAMAAGWALLESQQYLSLHGWQLVLANFGASATRGEGLPGVRHAPLGLLAWLLLGFAPLIIGLWLLKPRSASQLPPATNRERPAAPPRPSVKTPIPATPVLTPSVKPRRPTSLPQASMPTPPPMATPPAGETMMPSSFSTPKDDDALERR